MAETFTHVYQCDVCTGACVRVHSEGSAEPAARALRGWLRVDCERVDLEPGDPRYRTTTLICPRCTAGDRAPVPSDLAAPLHYPEPALDVFTAKGGAS